MMKIKVNLPEGHTPERLLARRELRTANRLAILAQTPEPICGILMRYLTFQDKFIIGKHAAKARASKAATAEPPQPNGTQRPPEPAPQDDGLSPPPSTVAKQGPDGRMLYRRMVLTDDKWPHYEWTEKPLEPHEYPWTERYTIGHPDKPYRLSPRASWEPVLRAAGRLDLLHKFSDEVFRHETDRPPTED